jgi:hypothetical protein
MSSRDPNVDSVELVVNELGELCNNLVLVGGCAVGLLITDRARPSVRETKDVDLVAEVISMTSYYALERKLQKLGFEGVDEVICRFRKEALLIDVMPMQDIGFSSSNRWYPLAAKYAETHELPSGQKIRMISAALFVATKLDAFHGRGKGDYAHHDIEDIVNIVDGREELFDEVNAADPSVKDYIMQEFDALIADEMFTERLSWHLNPDEASQRRLPILIERFRKIAGL